MNLYNLTPIGSLVQYNDTKQGWTIIKLIQGIIL